MPYSGIYDYRSKICDDEMIGFITKKNGTIHYFQRDDYESLFVGINNFSQYCESKGIKNIQAPILIVLESPHINEFFQHGISIYDSQDIINSRPANGTTGENLRFFLASVLNENIFVDNAVYPVIIINAVRAQCSCGCPTRLYRDTNFIECFYGADSSLSRCNFIERIQGIQTSNKISLIINACTKGDNEKVIGDLLQKFSITTDKRELRSCVEKELLDNFKEKITLYKINHPSCWKRKQKNRTLSLVSRT